MTALTLSLSYLMSNPLLISRRFTTSFSNKKKKEEPFIGIIHNAAVLYLDPFEITTPERLQDTLHINLLAPILITHKFLSKIRENQGRIIFVSSPAADLTIGFHGIYDLTKSSLRFLAQSIRRELAQQRISLSVIQPGIVLTDMGQKVLYSIPVNQSSPGYDIYGQFWSEEMRSFRQKFTHGSFIIHSTKETNESIWDALTSERPLQTYYLGNGWMVKYMNLLPEWMVDYIVYYIHWPGILKWPQWIKKFLI